VLAAKVTRVAQRDRPEAQFDPHAGGVQGREEAVSGSVHAGRYLTAGPLLRAPQYCRAPPTEAVPHLTLETYPPRWTSVRRAEPSADGAEA
jgi:hypothetical protein